MSNSEYYYIVDISRRLCGVSAYRERGTTQTKVKVPKYQLSVNGLRAYKFQDREEVGLEAANL